MPLLFSYGTLQQDGVQMATFGRPLEGQPDALVGYATGVGSRSMTPTSSPRAARSHHPIVVHTGWGEDRVEGAVFEITDDELDRADAYEVDAYRRVLAPLASGLKAWVYVDALRRAARRRRAGAGEPCASTDRLRAHGGQPVRLGDRARRSACPRTR